MQGRRNAVATKLERRCQLNFDELKVLVRNFLPRLWACVRGLISDGSRIGEMYVNGLFRADENERIEPKAIGGAGTMIHKIGNPRRLLGGLVIAIFALGASQALGQNQKTSSLEFTWHEGHGIAPDGTTDVDATVNGLTALNTAIDTAADSDVNYSSVCFTISGTSKAFVFPPASACGGNANARAGGTSGDLIPDVALKDNAHVDVEDGGTSQTLILIGSGSSGTTITVTLKVTPFDEPPEATKDMQATRYLGKDGNFSINIAQEFNDPEGTPVKFGATGEFATSTDVWVCDGATAGTFASAESTVPPIARGAEPSADVSGFTADNCSVSNENAAGSTPDPGTAGNAGNRVVTTRKTGPILNITANSLVIDDDTDAETPAVDRPAGTYDATVYVRVWSQATGAAPLSSQFIVIPVRVKVGANNLPQFAGGAVGYAVTVKEGDGSTDIMPSWYPADLDENGVYNDELKITLEGNSSAKDAKVTLFERKPDATTTPITPGALRLDYVNLDFETDPSFQLTLKVTDNWLPEGEEVSVPITVTVTNENELDKLLADNKVNGDGTIRLLKDREHPIELSTLFSDPEGDTLSYTAFSNIGDEVVKINEEQTVVTFKGTLAAGETANTRTVTLSATDGKNTETYTIMVETRETNNAPVLTIRKSGTLSIGLTVAEKDSKGAVLSPGIAYTDDANFIGSGDNKPKAMLTVAGTDIESDLFEAVVNDSTGMVNIKVNAEGLDYEDKQNGNQHALTLKLIDSWEPDKMSEELTIHVTVTDSNDAPKADGKVPGQMVVVKGSGFVDVSQYFTDQDGDRLIVTATSANPKFATVNVTGLAKVNYQGVAVGTATINLVARDSGKPGEPTPLTATSSFEIEVSKNNAPTVNDDAVMAQLPPDNTINVGATHDVTLARLFTDPDAESSGDEIKSIVATTSDESKLLVVPTNNGDTITLVGRASGMATLTITATDGGGNSTPITEMITVNDAPAEAMPFDPQTLDRVTPLALDVSGTFTDSDDGAENLVITAEVLGEGADLASAEVMGTMLTVTGLALGKAEVKLTATDPHGATATSVFEITVENIAPVVALAVEDATSNRVDDLTVDLSETFTDADGGEDFMPTITATSEGDADLELTVEGLELMVNSLTLGTSTVTLVAEDADGAMVETTFEVTVENILPVVAMSIESVMTNRVDGANVSLAGTFSDRDGGEDFMPTIEASIDKMAIASLTVEDAVLNIQGLTLGSAVVTLEATDADGGMVETSFDLTIENLAPVVAMSIEDMTTNRVDDLTLDLSATFTDRDGGEDFMPNIVATASGDAEVSFMVDGTSLMIDAIGLGTTTITVTATDADGSMIETTFNLTVENLMPVVANLVPAQTTTRVTDVMVDISETFMDPDYGDLTIVAVSDDEDVASVSLSDLMLTIDGTGLGGATVTLTASDPDGGMVSTTFEVTIENIDPVVAMSIPDQTTTRIEDLSIDISGVFSDADATNGLDIVVSLGDNTIVSAMIGDDMMLGIEGLLVGSTSVTLTATDMDGAMAETMFNVEIMNIEPVVANAVADQTTTRVEDLTLDLANTFSDADNDALTIVATAADGSILDLDLSGTSLTVTSLVVGDTTITLTATDAHGAMVETMFSVTVMNVAPVAVNSLSPVTLEIGGESVSQAIGGIFTDDGDPLTYTVTMGNSGIASGAVTGTTATFGAVSRGDTTATVTATDPHGGSVSVSASVTVGDGELRAVAAKSLAGFGRALLASVSSSVGSRLMTDSRSTDLTLDAWAPVDQNQPQTMSLSDTSEQAWNVVQSVNSADTTASSFSSAGMTGIDALRSTVGNQFALNLGTSDSPSQWSVWGNLDRQSYEGTGYDGMASNVYLGVDVTAGECWMFGVAVASNSGESDYSYGTATQTMDLSLTTVLPYVSYQPSDKTSLWGVAGFGSGELDTTVVGTTNDVSDLSANITMVGGRQHLTSTGRLDLALRADAAIASIETDSGSGAADGLMADVNRIRAGLEGSFTTDTGQGGTLTPFGQVSLRSDGGDGDTGTGIEISGGVRMASDVFTLEVRGRTLAMHSADDYKESGFSLMATLNPSASATGVSVTMAPRWGADAQGSDMLWQDTVSVNPMHSYGVITGFGNDGSTKSLETKIGYGMLVGQERYLLTPFVDVAVSDSQRQELLVGATLRQMIRGNANLDVSLALGRVEERTGENGGKIGLNATLRF